ncbi:tetratricopeptide repeat protein [Mycolicibacterium brumae]|uniref:Tetratricopeptide repeat-containing protein n=1 Tax=Mycolicibacterium brumae TaxID=85968 RepID=A0A2G5PC72_9MYCO|nr:tetratricopeptide repeat protein [Mycolicibacterium brumae]MCV7193152.1 tetratricopeptide repeat protein [Mycolicibacterium brumae]PIB75935.1 tetratricopeptide repeat-containing protein [Mycolicibacterium brumae]UWW09807.1 tetratricopeptide repeat protein [Mycolicibacterium brumae]
MSNSLALNIFVASPGDLSTERAIVSACIDEHNARQNPDGVRFAMVGWETVRGTARRPQEAINELIAESHFLIALFKEHWGSNPGSPWGFTSGTEEELFTGLLALGQPEHPMRDIWVAFISTTSPAAQIENLQTQMKSNHSLMYEAVSDSRDLKTKLTDRLAGWASATQEKVARHIDLLPSSGKDLLRAASLGRDGAKLVQLGHPEAGGQKLKESAALGGPPEQLAYAKYLERRGELNAAQEIIQSSINYFTTGPGLLNSPSAADAFSADARILRRRGKAEDAIGRLQQALTLVTGEDSASIVVSCRILDDLGLAFQDVKDFDAARDSFERSLERRRVREDVVDVCQSLVNLARVEGRMGNVDSASKHAEEALAGLREVPPTTLHANAEVLYAQLRLRRGQAILAIENTERAIAINRQIGNRHGEAIALLLSAQCHRSAGNLACAKQSAQECLELNISMGDEYGQRRANWLLNQLESSA